MRPSIELAPLGGLGEFGKNSLLVRSGDDTIVVDAGISFPDESLPGVDRVAPDFAELGRARVCGVFLTHGHEDHIGALGLLLDETSAPIYATDFTARMARRRLIDSGRPEAVEAVPFERTVSAGAFRVTFLPVSHSVPQSAALLIEAHGRRILHTGDFKLDDDAPAGERTDLAALAARAGGCDLALVDSTNADRPGACPSESTARTGLGRTIESAAGRVVVTTFSSHVARLEGVAAAARATGRRIAFLGRSVREIAEIAVSAGYLSLPPGFVASREQLAEIPGAGQLLVCAGSQGEPLSALTRIALDRDPNVHLAPGDVVVFSARTIPGREQGVLRVVDHLLRRGARVFQEEPGAPTVHVSGHAYGGDLRALLEAVRPRAVMPVHGGRKALVRCGETAVAAGVPPDQVFICDNGDAIFLDDPIRFQPAARTAGAVFLDAAGGVEIAGESIRERRLLGAEGLVVVLAVLGRAGLGKIEVIARGLSAPDAALSREIEREITDVFADASREELLDPEWARSSIRQSVRRLCRRRFSARPLIIPIVAEG